MLAINKESEHLRDGLTVLATIGSSTPFIGLFGTVIGIMNAFIEIAEQQNTNLAVVAPGIAEAFAGHGSGVVCGDPGGDLLQQAQCGCGPYLAGYEFHFADEFATILSRQLDS